MSVYFVTGRVGSQPTLYYMNKFEDATVLDWFRRHWERLGKENSDRLLQEVLGHWVHGWNFRRYADDAEPWPETPTTFQQLVDCLQTYLGRHNLKCAPHLVQTRYQDDEFEQCQYFFDDHFLALDQNRKKAEFILRESWELPDQAPPQPHAVFQDSKSLLCCGPGEGAAYFAFFDHYFKPLRLLRLDGVRLPDLTRQLAQMELPPLEEESWYDPWSFELRLVRSLLLLDPPDLPQSEKPFLNALRKDPSDRALWNAYSDWLQDQGLPCLGLLALRRACVEAARHPLNRMMDNDSIASEFGRGSLAMARMELQEWMKKFENSETPIPATSSVQVSDHVAQLSFASEGRRWYRWIFFDDLWAGAYPDLAQGILRANSRWDVLS